MSTSSILSAMRQEVASILQEKVADGAAGRLGKVLSSGKGRLAAVGRHLHKHEDAYDLGGLGVLGAVTGSELSHAAKKDAITGKRNTSGMLHTGAELAGLATLAAPVAAKIMTHH